MSNPELNVDAVLLRHATKFDPSLFVVWPLPEDLLKTAPVKGAGNGHTEDTFSGVDPLLQPGKLHRPPSRRFPFLHFLIHP